MLVGPTAVGKTSVAIEIAKKLGTAVVSADSRQVYRELTIGTAKPTADELSQVRHFMIDSYSITEDYDAAVYGAEALEIIHEIFKEKEHAVLCGGSGLYVKAVTEGFDDIPEIDSDIRKDIILNYEQSGIGWLQEKMLALDKEYYGIIDQQNPHRLIRALEVRIGTGKSISTFRKNKPLLHDFHILKIGLELPKEELYKRIDARMDRMIKQGLFEEAQGLYPMREKNALQTVGYKEIFDFLDKKYSYEEALKLLKQNSRRYAKRQMTWFKKDLAVHWFAPSDMTGIMEIIIRNS